MHPRAAESVGSGHTQTLAACVRYVGSYHLVSQNLLVEGIPDLGKDLKEIIKKKKTRVKELFKQIMIWLYMEFYTAIENTYWHR